MIEFEMLQDMFDSIKSKGKWNMDGPMLWGYFFTDRSPQKLIAFIPVLEELGYRYVSVYDANVDDGMEKYCYLHVEKEEIHSPESLFERNSELYALAEKYNLGSYDGMDVGLIQKK